jgi:hypothetical protein
MKMSSRSFRVLASSVAISLISLSGPMGCSSTYYAVWQKLGYEKRDILVSRVVDERDDQAKAKEQFKSTLDQLKELTNFNGGKLEEEYKKLKASYESCQDRATAVSKKIASVDKVANDMFAEWTAELDQYSDPNLKAASEKKLADSKARYQQLRTAMQSSESKMQPVLVKFHDVVMTLNDDLNAAAVNSIQGTSAEINGSVESLIKDMDASIDEANAFIDNMKKG